LGLSVTAVDNDIVDLTIRAGGAARQAFYRDGRTIAGRDGNRLTLTQLDDHLDFGGEGTATAGLRFTRTFSVATRFDSFLGYQLFLGDQERFPFRWDSTATLALGRYASANYTFSLRRDEVVIEKLQMIHGLAFTLQASLF